MSLLTTLKFIAEHPLNKGKKGRALFGFLKWQIGSRLVPGEVVYHWIDGARFIVRPGETGLTQNIYCGLQEFCDMAYVLHVLNSEDLFIDVGANAGSYTILACAVRGARGYCFEPVPSTFQRLTDNLKLNDLLGRVQVHNIGLADKEGEALFTADLDTTNHLIAPTEAASDAIVVKVLSLDQVLASESPSLIKIDVEGLETLVINGMLCTLGNPSLHSVIVELNGSGAHYGFDDQGIVEKMREFGFRMYSYEPFSRTITPISAKNPDSSNTLFLRHEDFIRQRLASAPSFRVGSHEI
ncbi:MAG: FkbM family methyltransferase [Chloroflexi bacterium]|nr:MAG: FkbM family methyltransferase [Chloroflexota bacterium]